MMRQCHLVWLFFALVVHVGGQNSIQFAASLGQFIPDPCPQIDPEGNRIAFSARDGEAASATRQILVWDYSSRALRAISSKGSDSWAPVWSSDGRSLAYFKRSRGSTKLAIWQGEAEGTRTFVDADACDDQLCWDQRPQWLPDGKHVLFLAMPQVKEERSVLATHAKFALVRLDSHADRGIGGGVRVPSAESVDIRIADVRSGRSLIVAGGAAVRNLAISPNGTDVLAVARAGLSASGMRQGLFDLFVLPLTDLSSTLRLPLKLLPSQSTDVAGIRPALPHIQHFGALGFGWSPDSSRIAFTTQGAESSGDVVVLDVRTNIATNLTKSYLDGAQEQAAIFHQNRDFGYCGKFGQTYRAPVWTSDGENLLCLREERAHERLGGKSQALWIIHASGGKVPRRVPIPESWLVLNVVTTQRGSAAWQRSPFSVTVRLRDDLSSRAGFARVNLVSGAIEGFGSIEGIYFRELNEEQSVSQPGKLAFVAENTWNPGDVTVWDLNAISSGPQRLIEGAAQSVDAREEILKWRAADGSPRAARVLLPQRPCPPGVLDVYAGDWQSTTGNRYAFGPGSLFTEALLRNGFAVIMPDLPLNLSDPTCGQIAEEAKRAVKALGDSGLVDGKRLAVMGHSFGGYTVNCLVTKTTRFRTGVSLAGLSDLFSMYFSPARLGVGQARPTGTPWSNFAQFQADSPVFHLESVETPLLLVHGERDATVPIAQSAEMFFGLQSLGKSTMLLQVPQGGHSDLPSNLDVQRQVVAWLSKYLR